jgi:drug/metabolite transporter (DMT)-like permease
MAKRWPPQGDRIVITAWQLGLGSVAGLLISRAIGESIPSVWPLRVVVAMTYHVLIATAVAYVLWYRLLASASATASSLAVLAVPVVGVLAAMALVGDRPSTADWLGFSLVLGGAALVVLKLPGRALEKAPD